MFSLQLKCNCSLCRDIRAGLILASLGTIHIRVDYKTQVQNTQAAHNDLHFIMSLHLLVSELARLRLL